MRHEAKAKARWYCTSHPDDRMAVDDIRNLIETNEHHQLAQRVSRAAADIDGTRPFWQVSLQLPWFSKKILTSS